MNNNMEQSETLSLNNKSNKGLKILLVIFGLIIMGVTLFIVWDKVIKNDEEKTNSSNGSQVENNNYNNEQNTSQIEEIALSNDKKVEINTKLNELSYILSSVNGFITIGGNLTTADNITYGVNYLDNEYYKMMFVKRTGKGEDDGIVYTSLEDAKQSYEQIFMDKFDLDKVLLEVKSYELFGEYYDEKVYANQSLVYNTISNNFYKLVYTSPNYYYLKATKLVYNKNSDTYTLTCDLLAQSIKEIDGIYYQFQYGGYDYADADILEYPENLVYNKVNIEYKKVNGLDKLISLVFVRK